MRLLMVFKKNKRKQMQLQTTGSPYTSRPKGTNNITRYVQITPLWPGQVRSRPTPLVLTSLSEQLSIYCIKKQVCRAHRESRLIQLLTVHKSAATPWRQAMIRDTWWNIRRIDDWPRSLPDAPTSRVEWSGVEWSYQLSCSFRGSS
jgi:hypothetical protein